MEEEKLWGSLGRKSRKNINSLQTENHIKSTIWNNIKEVDPNKLYEYRNSKKEFNDHLKECRKCYYSLRALDEHLVKNTKKNDFIMSLLFGCQRLIENTTLTVNNFNQIKSILEIFSAEDEFMDKVNQKLHNDKTLIESIKASTAFSTEEKNDLLVLLKLDDSKEIIFENVEKDSKKVRCHTM